MSFQKFTLYYGGKSRGFYTHRQALKYACKLRQLGYWSNLRIVDNVNQLETTLIKLKQY